MRAVLAAIVAMGLIATPALAQDSSRVQVGRLSCNVSGGVGMIFGSSKSMSCTFHRKGHPNESYTGTIKKFGLDIGVTRKTVIEWLVFAAADSSYSRHKLAGNYVGASGEATVGVGVGANALIGGSNKAFVLQPVSVQAQTGLNLAVGVTSMTLR